MASADLLAARLPGAIETPNSHLHPAPAIGSGLTGPAARSMIAQQLYTNALAEDDGGDGPRNSFTDAEAKLIMEWHLEAKWRISVGHAIQASKYREWDVLAGLPSVIICTWAATMAVGIERAGDGDVFKYFLCILSVIGTILSFIFANTQHAQQYEQHRSSWTAYTVFANDAEAALARHAAGDPWFNAQHHLEFLYERWKELKGAPYNIPTLPEPPQHAPPSTAELVIRRWQLFAEHQMLRHQIAAQTYDTWVFLWHSLWMFIAALCSAACLGTFLPRNTRWYIAWSYISLMLNIFAVIIMTYLNFRRYSISADQHLQVSYKCRALHDRAARFLAQHPQGLTESPAVGEIVETLRTMLNDIAVNSPLIPTDMMARIERLTPPSNVYYAAMMQEGGGGAPPATPPPAGPTP
eukprot:RCo039487